MPPTRPKAKGGGYDFGAEVEAQELELLSKKLKSPPKSKDSLLKLLKQLRELLEGLPQEVEALGAAKDSLPEALLQSAILDNPDKDVQLYGTLCIVYMLRVYAPDTPYDDDQLKEVFASIAACFRRLPEPAAGIFELCRSVLQVTANVKFYVLLLDIDEQLVEQLCISLLDAARPETLEAIEQPAVSILSGIIDELDDVPPRLSEALLYCLVAGDGNKAAQRLASLVVAASETKLRPVLQRVLIGMVSQADQPQPAKQRPVAAGKGGSGRGGKGSSKAGEETFDHSMALLRKDLPNTLVEVHQHAPFLLLPVLPMLKSRLHADDEAVRTAAADLIVAAFSTPSSGMAAQYGDIFAELLRRYADNTSALRMHMLNSTARLAEAVKGTELHRQVLGAAIDRLQDFDEKVRAAAIKALCELMTGLGPHYAAAPEALDIISSRLRDRKLPVRKAALSGLLGLLRGVCEAVESGELLLEEAQPMLRLPLRWCTEVMRDLELRPHMLVMLAAPSAGGALIPLSTDARVAASIWGAMWSFASPLDRESLVKVVGLKATAAKELRELVELQRTLKTKSGAAAAGADGVAAAQAKLGPQCGQLARAIGGSKDITARMYPAIHKMYLESKDNHFWDRLATMANPTTPVEGFAATRKDALARLAGGGSKSPYLDVFNQLANMVAPTLLPTPQLLALLKAVQWQGGQLRGGAGLADVRADEQACSQLLIGVSKTAPTLFAGTLQQLTSMLTPKDLLPHELSVTTAARVLASAGKHCQALPPARPAAVNATGAAHAESDVAGEEGPARGPADSPAAAAPPPELLITALRKLCTGPFPKAAKAAPAALSGVLPKDRARESLEELAEELTQRCSSSSAAVSTASVASAIQAMSTIGRIAPRVFSEHVTSLCTFVTTQYLYADLTALPPPAEPQKAKGKPKKAGPAAAAGDGSDGEQLAAATSAWALPGEGWGTPSASIALKAAALKALCRGCSPEVEAVFNVPSATAEVVTEQLEPLLAQLLDIEADEDVRAEMGAVQEVDRSLLRYTAAMGLLWLARRHDSRLAPATYALLSLSMQDPVMEVRRDFGEKVRRFLHHFLAKVPAQVPGQPGGGHMVARYAAFLALAGMDPRDEHREAAARALREIVVLKRAKMQQALMQHAAAAAGVAGPSNGSATSPGIADMPDFMMAFLIYLLAHHPDCPRPDDPECAPTAEDYRPFQDMLQFALEPLLAPSAGMGPGESLPALNKLLRMIKATKDVDESFSPSVYALCDIALAVARAIVLRDALAKDKRGGAAAAEALASASYPGPAVLPVKLMVMDDRAAIKVRMPDGSCLPKEYGEVVLNAAIPELGRKLAGGAAPSSAAKPARRRRSSGGEDEEGAGGSPSGSAGEEASEGRAKRRRAASPGAAVKKGKKAAAGGKGAATATAVGQGAKGRKRKAPAAAEEGGTADGAEAAAGSKAKAAAKRGKHARNDEEDEESPGARQQAKPSAAAAKAPARAGGAAAAGARMPPAKAAKTADQYELPGDDDQEESGGGGSDESQEVRHAMGGTSSSESDDEEDQDYGKRPAKKATGRSPTLRAGGRAAGAAGKQSPRARAGAQQRAHQPAAAARGSAMTAAAPAGPKKGGGKPAAVKKPPASEPAPPRRQLPSRAGRPPVTSSPGSQSKGSRGSSQ